MLTMEDTLYALRIERIAPRTEGCFGSAYSGSGAVRRTPEIPEVAGNSHGRLIIGQTAYERFEDSRTGEPLYRFVGTL